MSDGPPDPEDVDWGPTRKSLEEDDPCPECGYPFDPGEWETRHLRGGPTPGETWLYTCPDCEQETVKIAT